MDAKINEFIETWTPPGHVEATEGEFERDLRELMESYHQHRQAEEAQERYEKGIAEITKPGWALRPALIIRIAAGIKGNITH